MSAELRLVATAPHSTSRDGVVPALLRHDIAFPLLGSESSSGDARHGWSDHIADYGPRPGTAGVHGDALLADLTTIALTGRGGGHFPVAKKWRAVLDAGSGGIVVVNGAEGEACSAKDAALLQYRPHLVLDGAVCAAEALAAHSIVVWLHDRALTTRRSVERALAERRSAGLIEPPIVVRTGPDRYLTGESTAVVRALSGGPALPQFRRHPSATSGIEGLPTLVSNVETFARTALAARTGAGSYVPSTLLTVVRDRERVVHDSSHERTLAEVIASLWSEPGDPAAALVGGYGGTWVPWADLQTLPVHQPQLRAVGHSLGAGVLAPLPQGMCGLVETADIIDYLAHSSARQCGPCQFGLASVATLMRQLAAGATSRAEMRRLVRFTAEVDGRGGCNHPDGAVRLISTALRTFDADVEHHVREGRCLHPAASARIPVPGRI